MSCPSRLPTPDWLQFEGDLARMKQAGYDAVELQIADPARFDGPRVRRSLDACGYTMCAFQTGSTYSSRHNCLCTADDSVPVGGRIELLKSFVELAAQWRSIVVFGSLQGRLTDEPDRAAGAARIRDAISEVGRFASERGATDRL